MDMNRRSTMKKMTATMIVALAAAVIQRLFSPGWPLLLGLISANILGVSELVKRSDESSVAQ